MSDEYRTYVFKIQLSLSSSIRIRVERRLYTVPKSVHIHFAPCALEHLVEYRTTRQ